MKQKRKLYILLAAVFLAVGLLTVPALADAGNFSGHSSYGGGSGYSGGSSFGGSGYGGGSFVIFGGGGDGSGEGGGTAAIIVAVVIILIIARIVRQSQLNASMSGGYAPEAEDEGSLEPISSLKETDPNFSEQAFREKVSNLYVQMQDAWQKKDFEPMRPYMTDALYTQFDRQLDELRESGQTNYVDRIAVLSVVFSGWRTDETNDTVVSLVNTRIVDYTLDDRTGKLVTGSKTMEKFMTYEWTLIRSKGTKTAAPGDTHETDAKRCPSCGAPLDVNQSARCPYCGSVVTARDFDWVISSIKGISQRNGR